MPYSDSGSIQTDTTKHMEVTRWCSMSLGESHDQITPDVSEDEAFLGILKILIENYGTGSRQGQYHVSISASHTGLPPIHRLHLPLLDSSQHLCIAHLHETPNSTDVINGTTVMPLVNSTVTTVTDALFGRHRTIWGKFHASELFQWSPQLKGWILSSF